MRKLVRRQLPVDIRNALLNAMAHGLRWDDFDKSAVRTCLREMQSGLCAYCERRLDKSDAHTRIDHFVPQSSPKGRGRIFDWTNHYLSCDCPDTCDSHKSSDERVIVNPDTDDPSRFFAYLATGTIQVAEGLSPWDAQKAKDTLEVLNLRCHSLASLRIMAFNRALKHLKGENELRRLMQDQIVEFHTFFEFMLSR